MVFMLPGYYNQPYAASLHKSFNDNYDEVFRVEKGGCRRRVKVMRQFLVCYVTC